MKPLTLPIDNQSYMSPLEFFQNLPSINENAPKLRDKSCALPRDNRTSNSDCDCDCDCDCFCHTISSHIEE